MRIGFSDIERVRRDPKSLFQKNAFHFPYSKFRRWQDALARYHIKDNLKTAEDYLEKTFARMADNSLNRRDFKKYLTHLHEYDINYQSLDSQKFAFRKTMVFDLSLGYQLSGQIPRLDINVTTDGYSLFFFCKDQFDWQSELRFPILQDSIAEEFGCDSDVVKVGLYILNEAKHVWATFDKTEIADAKSELGNILQEVEKYRK